MFASIQFATAENSMSTVKKDVIGVLKYCKAMNPVFTYMCTQYDLALLRNSLDEEQELNEINWINDLLSCYPQEVITRATPYGRRHIKRPISELRIPSVHSDRRFARKVIRCVIQKVKSK